MSARTPSRQFKTAKLEKVNFEPARLKAWKFGAKTEAMSAEQRRLFEETLAEDEPACWRNWRNCKASCLRKATDRRSSSADRSGKRCRRICVAWSTATSPRTPPAPHRAAGGRWGAWART